MKTHLDFLKYKAEKRPISMVTCYDYSFGLVVNESLIDAVLVGDSVAMTVHGFESTLHADVEMMALHTRAVRRGAPDKFTVADMPFLSVRKGLTAAMDAVDQLMKAGAHAVKIEGVDGHEDIISHIVQSGVPVMGHLGLTPQSYLQLGGYKVQGRTPDQAEHIQTQAQKLQELGVFALVLECVPSQLASKITQNLQIATIGIGAGAECDGQILVIQDLMGLSPRLPKFVRPFGRAQEGLLKSLNSYHLEVVSKNFPSSKEIYV